MTCAQISNATANYCRADQYEHRIAELEAEIAALKAERDTLQERATRAIELTLRSAVRNNNYISDLAAARQSRARLVRLVRALRNDLRNANMVSNLCEDDLADVQGQRDSAEAWAAAWKRAAMYERCITLWPPTFARTAQAYRANGSLNRRARRAAEAAEAVERR